jgi:hypothetical protein
MQSAENPQLVQIRRRNGRLAACNPCRSRKTACDHARPVCNRCSRRGDDANCIYDDGAADTDPAAAIQHLGHLGIDAPSLLDSPGSPASVSGYQGFMSHSHLFEQARSSLPLSWDPNGLAIDQGVGLGTDKRAASYHSLSQPMQHMCLFVLRNVPGYSNTRTVFSEASSPHQTTLWDQLVVESTIKTLATWLDRCKDEAALATVADLICRNTTRPMREDDHLESREWLDQFIGPNVRWESIALVWAHLERIGDMTAALYTHRLSWKEGQGSPETSMVYLNYCVQLARHFAGANVLLTDMYRRKAVLESMTDGDAGAFLP